MVTRPLETRAERCGGHSNVWLSRVGTDWWRVLADRRKAGTQGSDCGALCALAVLIQQPRFLSPLYTSSFPNYRFKATSLFPPTSFYLSLRLITKK